MSKETEDPIVQRIIEAMKDQHISQKELTGTLGLSNGAFTKWKNGENRSYLKYMDQLSKALNVTVEFLLYGAKEGITDTKTYLINAIEDLSEQEQKYFLEMIKGYKKLR